METIPWGWLVWGLIVYIAIRSIFSMTLRRRERLIGLLAAYIEEQKENLRRKQRIANLQQKIKRLKAEAKAKSSAELAAKEREAIAAESGRKAA